VAADSDMESVTKVLENHYRDAKAYSWYGHPDRLKMDSKKDKPGN
jgi:hypothetical protein